MEQLKDSMIKITFIGAGSTVFMKNILTDILLEKNFSNCEIVLQDIDEKRLKTSNLVAEKVAKAEDGKCAFSGKAASKESKVTIAVCCGKCEKKGKADPKALLAKLQKKK